MTKYKWSLLGLIVSSIVFIVFLINPLINFVNAPRYPTEPVPETLQVEMDKYFHESSILLVTKLGLSEEDEEKAEQVREDYYEWRRNVPKKINLKSALREFGKSFYHWNLFWILIIVFSFMAYNYKKKN